ncbi:hypothetical protein KC333_g183 [Hortaea werneckii]|nr:hypothetical protein KC333_g183 [Hortaea werneckii]
MGSRLRHQASLLYHLALCILVPARFVTLYKQSSYRQRLFHAPAIHPHFAVPPHSHFKANLLAHLLQNHHSALAPPFLVRAHHQPPRKCRRYVKQHPAFQRTHAIALARCGVKALDLRVLPLARPAHAGIDQITRFQHWSGLLACSLKAQLAKQYKRSVRGEATREALGAGVVDLCNDQVSGCGLVATMRSVEPERSLLVINMQRASGSRRDGRRWHMAEPGPKGEGTAFLGIGKVGGRLEVSSIRSAKPERYLIGQLNSSPAYKLRCQPRYGPSRFVRNIRKLLRRSEIGREDPPSLQTLKLQTLWEFFGGGSLFPFHDYQRFNTRLYCRSLTTA